MNIQEQFGLTYATAVAVTLMALAGVGALWGWLAMVVLGAVGVSVGYWTTAAVATALVLALRSVKGLLTTI